MHRPSPIESPWAKRVDRRTPAERAVQHLLDGEAVLVEDRLSTARAIYEVLVATLQPPADDAPYAARQAYEKRLEAAASKLLVPVKNHALALAGAPELGFIAALYPQLDRFAISYLGARRMLSAWSHYERGIHLAVLGHAVHPFFGTYAPTRTTHLELFATWLAAYDGPLERTADVGTGCGVLALMLARKGARHVLATDINPNAVRSVTDELKRHPEAATVIEPRQADLLGDEQGPLDLIVFNPPWSHGPPDGPLATALTFDDALFPRFFDQAHAALAPHGRVVLLFSDLLRLTQPDVPHPIDAELEGGRFTLVDKLRRKVKASTTRDGRRRTTRERVEVWELRKGDGPA